MPVLASRVFMVNGQRVTLAAGIKNGAALVVLGLPDAAGHNQLSNITIEYPMKTAAHAINFVNDATDDVVTRGLAKYEAEVSGLAKRVNNALNQPYTPDVGYRRRGK